MNVKNIIKVVALAMLMPAMLLNSACSNEDEPVIDNENAPSRGYPLYVTVNATRQGDAGTNRATYNDGTRTLAFSAGDKLFVHGIHVTDDTPNKFGGFLTWVSGGTFTGTIYTQLPFTGTADDLFSSANSVAATLLPNGYESYGFLSINDPDNHHWGASLNQINWANAIATSTEFETAKALAVEQFSFESTVGYSSGSFTLSPANAILNFTITGLTANVDVSVNITVEGSAMITDKVVTTDDSGNATFAIGVEDGWDLNDIALTIDGNAITLVNSSKILVEGHVYNITRSAAPPTLAQTMTNAGMTVKVMYNHSGIENYCLFSSVGNGTYTFQTGYGSVGGDEDYAKALVVEDGKLVFKQNIYDAIDDDWSNYGFSVTFDTSKNTYSNWVGPRAQENNNPSFISVEVNSVPIALTQIITVSDLVKEEGQGWFAIIYNNSDKIKEENGNVVRISDNAKLQYMEGDVWQYVGYYEEYNSMKTYKFEGD